MFAIHLFVRFGRCHRWAWAAVMLLSAQAACAQSSAAATDMGRLYALPPEGSIYVRVVNPSSVAAQVQIGDEKTQTLSASGNLASDYHVQAGGAAYHVRVDGKPLKLGERAPTSGFITLVLPLDQRGAVHAIADDAAGNDGLKAELSFYNLEQGCTASLHLAGGGGAVFASVASMQRGVRAINPVQAQLTARCGTAESGQAKLPELKVGDRYSLFLLPGSGAPTLRGVVARTAAYKAR